MAYWRMGWKTVALFAITLVAVSAPLAVRLFRGSSRRLGRIGSRASSFWARNVTRTLGMRIVAENVPNGATFLVASNHVSYLDIWVLGSIYPSQFVAKREIRGWPLVGWISRAAGTLFVDRDTPRDAVRVIRQMRTTLDNGINLTLFPEGGTSSGQSIRPFLPTLLEPAVVGRVPCYAATVSYETPGEPAPLTETVCWHAGQNFVTHILRIMRMAHLDVRVRFSEAPVIATNRKELADRLWRDAMRRHVPLRAGAAG